MEVQAALGSDIALVFDECTPYHADRDYTARSTERTHRWLDRCLDWHEREGPERQAVFGIVQGGVHEDLRRESAAGGLRGRRSTGSRSAAPSAATRRRCAAVLALTAPLLPDGGAQAPARDRRGRRPARRHRPRPRRLRLRRPDPPRPPRRRPRPRPRATASASTCARPAGRATATRWSRAAPARPASTTTATTSATSPAPRS